MHGDDLAFRISGPVGEAGEAGFEVMLVADNPARDTGPVDELYWLGLTEDRCCQRAPAPGTDEALQCKLVACESQTSLSLAVPLTQLQSLDLKDARVTAAESLGQLTALRWTCGMHVATSLPSHWASWRSYGVINLHGCTSLRVLRIFWICSSGPIRGHVGLPGDDQVPEALRAMYKPARQARTSRRR